MAKTKISKKTNWKTTDKRFVGFIDLLGFKDKVMRKDHNEIYGELNKISNLKKDLEELTGVISKGYFEDSDIYIVSFSDSIVVFSKNDSFKSFEYFLIAVRFLYGNAIKEKIALKGGIAYGEISVNKTEQIYFGQAIIDAYFMEEDVNYLGMSCHNSIDEYVENNTDEFNKSKITKSMLFSYQTPLKCGKITHFNLDWFYMCVENNDKKEDELETLILEKLKSFYSTVSGSPRRYVDNTIDLFLTLSKNKLVTLNLKNV